MNQAANDDRTDAMLDQALEMTFPASDPFTIYMRAGSDTARPDGARSDVEVRPRR